MPVAERLARIIQDERERLECPQCGRPITECSDPERDWFPQRTLCYATMAQSWADARYDKKHEARPYHDGSFKQWSKDRNQRFRFHARDGVKIWVHSADLTPDDDFLD